MNSSTSSSSPSAPNEWRVVLLLIVGLLMMEGTVRLFETRLSLDLAQIRNLPSVAQAMRQHPGSKILLMGNSLTRHGVNVDAFTAGLRANGRSNPQVFCFTPDGTSIVNWDYGLNRYFLNAQARPDELFIGTGRSHLNGRKSDASRLAAYYVDDSDLKRAWTEDTEDWEQKCEFALSRVSVLHSSRNRIKPHVFGTLVPHYFDIEQWINDQRRAPSERSGTINPSLESYAHLTRVLETCHRLGIAVTIFSIPVPQHDEEAAETRKIIEAHGARWLPLANTPGFTPAHFPDGYHLNEAGSEIFTQALVNQLAPR